jgi:hypothetical protein
MTPQASPTAQSTSSSAAAQQAAKLQSIGHLTARSSKIPRKAGELTAMLNGYLDGTTGQYQRQKGVPEPMQHLISRMQWTAEHVLGREEDEQLGRAEIKPKLVSTLKLNSSEVANYAKQKDLVQLHQDKGKQMAHLSEQLRGETGLLRLTKLPENGKGGHVGMLVTLHAESKQPRIERAPARARMERAPARASNRTAFACLALALRDIVLGRVQCRRGCARSPTRHHLRPDDLRSACATHRRHASRPVRRFGNAAERGAEEGGAGI